MIEKENNYDRRLDILVLGPMNSNQRKAESTNQIILQAIESILASPDASEFLKAGQIKEHFVHIPENFQDAEIIHGVLSKLDIADLAVVNISPREEENGFSNSNVFYELGLIHALGIPTILIAINTTPIQFYFNTSRIAFVDVMNFVEIEKKLKPLLIGFINPGNDDNYAFNRVMQFYDNLPIVDISAAIGLATGYYHNFVGRLLRDGSFISKYPDKIKQLIIVRPSDVMDTFDADKIRMVNRLNANGIKLKKEELQPPEGDMRGVVFFDHSDGIVIDLPRTIYPLKISPRLLSMQDRLTAPYKHAIIDRQNRILLKQASEKLLDRIELAIKYHVNREREGYRKNCLHFSTIDQLPDLVGTLKQ